MSRPNKVNPGTYTQRGRLTQDDAARELRKQNALGSPDTWQPVKKNAMPRPARPGDAGRPGTESAADDAGQEETSPTVETRPASRVTKKKTATKAAPAKPSKTVTSNTATAAAGKAKAAKPATKRAVTKTAQKAVMARNVGGAGPKSRSATKRRTS
jgi:hypothetical protein